MYIGSINIPVPLFSAPLSGISDAVFRFIAAEAGASVCYTEMVSARGLIEKGRGSVELLERKLDEPPDHIIGAQIFGSKPDEMAKAAFMIEENNWGHIIDINMGCPVKKVIKSGAGSALMKEPGLIAGIVRAVREAVSLPLTVKIRSGWDEASINAVEVARIAEGEGADAVIVHPRTRVQGFGGKGDPSVIASVKKAIGIPVIANGDICSASDARNILETTGADGVMIGRAALGNPFVFKAIRGGLDGCGTPPAPTKQDYGNIAMKHLKMSIELKGDFTAGQQIKKHLAWYSKGMEHSTKFRSDIFTANSIDELEDLTRRFFEL